MDSVLALEDRKEPLGTRAGTEQLSRPLLCARARPLIPFPSGRRLTSARTAGAPLARPSPARSLLAPPLTRARRLEKE